MRKLLRSWFFFAALLVLLLVCAVTLPQWVRPFLGQTQARFQAAADAVEAQVQAVWAER